MEEFPAPYVGCKSQQSSNVSMRGKERLKKGKESNKELGPITIGLMTIDHSSGDWAKFPMF